MKITKRYYSTRNKYFTKGKLFEAVIINLEDIS